MLKSFKLAFLASLERQDFNCRHTNKSRKAYWDKRILTSRPIMNTVYQLCKKPVKLKLILLCLVNVFNLSVFYVNVFNTIVLHVNVFNINVFNVHVFYIILIYLMFMYLILRWLHTVPWKVENTCFRPKISYIDILLEEWK